MMETIDTLAAHYGKHVLTKSGRRGFRMGCPVHSGKDPNCAVFESSAGRIGAFCFSLGCEPSAIMTAMEQDCNLEAINPLGHTFQGTYRRGSDPVDVWREDRPNGTKAYPTPGSRDGIPLLIHGREEDDLMIVIEGEKTGRAVQRAGYTAASYLGGSSCAGLADYSILKGKTAAIWPDNDGPGQDAAKVSAQKAADAGAAVVWLLDPVEGARADAADIPAEELTECISDLLSTSTVYDDPNAPPKPFRLVWHDLAESTRDLPPTEWLVPGLITVGESTLLVGAPKAGKTLLILDLLRAMTQTGKFLGFDVPLGRVWILSELTPRTLKGQMRLLNFEPDEGINAAFLTQQTLDEMTPQGVIDDIRWKFDDAIRDDRKPALVVLDTMGRWLSGKYLDYNGYGDMSAATMSILTLAADLGQHDTATLVSHHSNKSHRSSYRERVPPHTRG